MQVTQGHILSILRDLSPIISDLSHTINHVLKDTGGVIGDTFSTLDSIVDSAGDTILQLNKNIEQILVGCPNDPHHQQCAAQLRAASQGYSDKNTLLRVCIDETKIRNTLSERLVQISKLRTQCVSTFTRCLRTPPVDQCIQTEVNSVKSGIQENEIVLQKDVESIRTEVRQCVDSKAQEACGSLQSAIEEYKRCSGDD